MRHIAVGGSDGDSEIGISRIIDAQTHTRRKRGARGQIERSVTSISGGDDNDNSGADQPFHFHTERTLTAGEPLGFKTMAQAQIDAMNVKPSAIAVDFLNVVKRADNVTDLSLAVLIEDSYGSPASILALLR